MKGSVKVELADGKAGKVTAFEHTRGRRAGLSDCLMPGAKMVAPHGNRREMWTRNCLAQQCWDLALLWKTLQFSCPVDWISALSAFSFHGLIARHTCTDFSLIISHLGCTWPSPFSPLFYRFCLSGLDKPEEETTVLFRKSRLLFILNFTSDNFSIILRTRL